jgi:hypothetical protein
MTASNTLSYHSESLCIATLLRKCFRWAFLGVIFAKAFIGMLLFAPFWQAFVSTVFGLLGTILARFGDHSWQAFLCPILVHFCGRYLDQTPWVLFDGIIV